MEKERRLFKQSICKAFGLQGESQAEVLDRESGNEYLAQEIGLEHGSDLPTIGLDVAKLVGYHKFALMMVGGMIAPARKTKHHWSWEEVADFVRATRSELGL